MFYLNRIDANLFNILCGIRNSLSPIIKQRHGTIFGTIFGTFFGTFFGNSLWTSFGTSEKKKKSGLIGNFFAKVLFSSNVAIFV